MPSPRRIEPPVSQPESNQRGTDQVDHYPGPGSPRCRAGVHRRTGAGRNRNLPEPGVVATELEHSADRAQARGGLAAAAAFLERAATLTPEPARRAQRLLAAAKAKRDAGALDAALGLLVAVEAGPPDELPTAEVAHLREQIALMQRRGNEAARLLLSAARLLEPLGVDAARETHLEALVAAMWAGDGDRPDGLREAAEAARATPPRSGPPRAVDALLDGLAIRLTEGHAAAAPMLRRALELVLATDVGTDRASHWLWLTGGRTGAVIALELWDAESSCVLAAEQVRFARDTGALRGPAARAQHSRGLTCSPAS